MGLGADVNPLENDWKCLAWVRMTLASYVSMVSRLSLSFLIKCKAKNQDCLFRHTDNFQSLKKIKIKIKMLQVAVLPGATHQRTDGKYGVTKQNSGCDASIM